MLPLRHDDLVKRRGIFGRIKEKVTGWIRLIMSDTNSRNLLGFLCLNLTFAFVELFYGVVTNSLGLISDAFHMFFDCTGLLAGLVSVHSTFFPCFSLYTYGSVHVKVYTLVNNIRSTEFFWPFWLLKIWLVWLDIWNLTNFAWIRIIMLEFGNILPEVRLILLVGWYSSIVNTLIAKMLCVPYGRVSVVDKFAFFSELEFF